MKRARLLITIMAILVLSAFTYAVNAGACKGTSGGDTCPTASSTIGP